MINANLQAAKSILDEKFFCLFREANVLEVSLDKEDLPFLYLVTEDPELILMSFSVDFDNASVAAQIALLLDDITDTGVAESFYIAKTGEVHWEDDALITYAQESTSVERNPLVDMKPVSSMKH